MDENNNGFNTTDTDNLNDVPSPDYSQPNYDQSGNPPQFDYSQPNYGQPSNPPQSDYNPQGYGQPNYGQPGNPPQFDYSQPNYGQPNNTAQSDYNQVYNQPNYGQPNYNPQYNSYPDYSGGYQTEKKSDTKSILSLVFGIVGITVCNCAGLGAVGFGIAGVIMAILSKGDTGGKMNGMAVAGMIISIIGFIIGLAELIFMIYMMMNGGSVLT